MNLQETMTAITPVCAESIAQARKRFSEMAMPLGSMGLLGEAVVHLAGAQHTPAPDITRRAVTVFCADNGVVAQGVTQCGQEVTASVCENMGRGASSVCLMAQQLGVTVIPVDIGVAMPITGQNIRRLRVANGTQDMTQGPAMTREQCIRAIETGISLAEEQAKNGCGLLCVGEMGIGNTTTSAAVAAVLTGAAVEAVTGRGAGLSTEGLHRKIEAIRRAIAVNKPDPADPLDVLRKLGGFDLCGMVGVYLGGAAKHMPVVIDGVIAAAAALCAVRLCPDCAGYLLASHRTAEPAGDHLLAALGLQPVIDAGLRLGEGTGAVAAVGLFDLALKLYREMPAFADAGVEAYQPLC